MLTIRRPGSFEATAAGENKLGAWLASFGPLVRVGVEGTGSYGAGLARHLATVGVEVVEVDRPNRQLRRRQGKTDSLDAVEAARAAQSGRALGAAKSRDGHVEAIRALVVAKRSARSTKVKTMNQIRHLGFTAPDPLRAGRSGVSRAALATEAASLRPRPGTDPVLFATKTSLRLLGRRVLALDAEKAELDALLDELVTAAAPDLLAVHGVGTDTAALLLVAAGDQPRPAPQRSSLGAPVRRVTHPGVLREGHPLPALRGEPGIDRGVRGYRSAVVNPDPVTLRPSPLADVTVVVDPFHLVRAPDQRRR